MIFQCSILVRWPVSSIAIHPCLPHGSWHGEAGPGPAEASTRPPPLRLARTIVHQYTTLHTTQARMMIMMMIPSTITTLPCLARWCTHSVLTPKVSRVSNLCLLNIRSLKVGTYTITTYIFLFHHINGPAFLTTTLQNVFLYINFFVLVFLLETFKKCQLSAGIGIRREMFMLWIQFIYFNTSGSSHLLQFTGSDQNDGYHHQWNAFLFSSMSLSKWNKIITAVVLYWTIISTMQ